MTSLSLDGLRAALEEGGAKSPIPSFTWTDIENCPMDIYLSYLAEILVKLTECDPQVAYESIVWPDDLCDLSVVLPRMRLKDKNPTELAVELNSNFPKTTLFDQPFRDGINLRVLFSSNTLARILLPYILDRGSSYGKSHISAPQEPDAAESPRQKIVVEFSSPNIGKEFDGNHLRSTIIGAYIASLHESMGYDVVRMNFLGDWGKNIGLLAAGWSRFGSEELFERDPLKHLMDVYNQAEAIFKPEHEAAKKQRTEGHENAAIETQGISAERDEFFKKMEDGDSDALALWKRFRDVCITNYTSLYGRLNISFDDYSGESQVTQETITEVETVLKEKGFYDESEGAHIIDFKKHGYKGLGTAIARFSNGTSSYLLRDIAAVLEREKKYNFDKMIYVVSAKQDGHFQQLFKAIELMGYTDLANKLQHVSFGKVQGAAPKSGILLGDMLEQCQAAISKLLEAEPSETKEFQGGDPKVLETLSATALMVQDLSIRRSGNFTFDPQKIAVVDGNTGLYLQKWYAKISAKLKGTPVPRADLASADYALFEQEEYADVLRVLVQFPSIVKMAFKPLESSSILSYLFRLTDLLDGVCSEEKEGEEDEAALSSETNAAELAFFECVRLVLGNGMRMVGLVPLTIQKLRD